MNKYNIAMVYTCHSIRLFSLLIMTLNAFSFTHNIGRDHDSAIPRSRFSPETIPFGLHIALK